MNKDETIINEAIDILRKVIEISEYCKYDGGEKNYDLSSKSKAKLDAFVNKYDNADAAIAEIEKIEKFINTLQSELGTMLFNIDYHFDEVISIASADIYNAIRYIKGKYARIGDKINGSKY